ncbi:MAG TPA: AMP-binding protein, partial [Burkholderiaceae bacterium]|nr:AMP-binding protein [Burkholderiaceae bacterium]
MNFSPALQATIDRTRSHGIGDLLWRSARRAPDKTALVWRELRQSYAELDETVNRAANAMISHGIARGQRVALLSHNNHAFVVLAFAAARLGAILVPVNFMLKAAEVAYIVEHSGATALIAEDALLEVAQQGLAVGPNA